MTDVRKPLLSLAAALALSTGALTACSQQEETKAETGVTAEESGAVSTEDQLQEEAAQVGEAIEAGAMKAAQAIDDGTDKLAKEATELKAETQAQQKADASEAPAQQQH
jgi:hypothetical protein